MQSISLPLASRKLGRSDETWLVQILVRLNVIETHLAIQSPDLHVVQLDHLQNNIKLAGAEIDSLYLALRQNGSESQCLVACEVKGRSDDIIEAQVINQVATAFDLLHDVDVIVPMAAKAIAKSQIDVIQFMPVTRAQVDALAELKIATRAVYRLVPPIPGVGEAGKSNKKIKNQKLKNDPPVRL